MFIKREAVPSILGQSYENEFIYIDSEGFDKLVSLSETCQEK